MDTVQLPGISEKQVSLTTDNLNQLTAFQENSGQGKDSFRVLLSGCNVKLNETLDLTISFL